MKDKDGIVCFYGNKKYSHKSLRDISKKPCILSDKDCTNDVARENSTVKPIAHVWPDIDRFMKADEVSPSFLK